MASVNRPTLAGLQAQVEALRHNLNLVEGERDSLRMKLDNRNADLERLNDAYSAVTTRLDVADHRVACLTNELHAARAELGVTEKLVGSMQRTAAVQISERRAAMQRAREEAMRSVRVSKAQW